MSLTIPEYTEPEGFNTTEFVEFESDETDSRCESEMESGDYTDYDTDSSEEPRAITTHVRNLKFYKIQKIYRTILSTEEDFLPE